MALEVFRDFSYPLIVGSFDAYALPPTASILKVDRRGDRLHISAEMEKAEPAQRSYTLVREPLTRNAMTRGFPVQAVCRYVVVSPDGKVRGAGAARYGDDGTFAVDLRGLKQGRYTILTAVSLNGNSVRPDVRAIPYRAGP